MSGRNIAQLRKQPAKTESKDQEEERLRISSESDDISSESEEDVGLEKDSEDESERNVLSATIYEAICDFDGEETGDLTLKKGEFFRILSTRKDGWWEAENASGQKGLVPSTHLKMVDEEINFNKTGEEDRDLSYHHEEQKSRSSAGENVGVYAGLPHGFRPSSLAALLNEDKRFTTKAFLTPKLCKSGLAFKDIQWSSYTGQLKPVMAPVQRIITLIAFQHATPPSVGYDITSHHIRLCLHNGVKILSNVHTVRGTVDIKSPKTWNFHEKIPADSSCLDEGSIFVRTTNHAATIGILFQPCITYTKLTTGEKGEASCGWAFMRLLDDSGQPVANRNNVLYVHGGDPFQKNNDLTAGKSKRGPLKNLISKNRQPQLTIRIKTPNSEQKQQLDFLPATLVGPISSIPHIALYRQILADKLLKDRKTADSTELIHCPFIATFPLLFNEPDILDVLVVSWTEKLKNEKKALKKKDSDRLKNIYIQLYKETAYILMNCASLPVYKFAETEIEKDRKAELKRLMQLRQDKGPVAIVLQASGKHKPFSTEELSFDIVGCNFLPVDEI